MATPIRESIDTLVARLRDAFQRERLEGAPAAAARIALPGFGDDAAPSLRALCARAFATSAPDAAVADLLETCAGSPWPDLAVRNFEHYLERAGDPSVFFTTLVAARPVLDMLATVFGGSQYMAEIVVRNPATVYWLMEGATWQAPDTAADYAERFAREAALFQSMEAKLGAVRRAHRLALLRIGILDMHARDPVEVTALRLSALAEGACGAVLEIVDAAARGAQAPPSDGFAVIAMGKLGGAELNYSSDIDLIYVCRDTEDEDAMAYHTKLARRFTDALSSITDEGYLYRVDLRLRPDGKAGPLVGPETAVRLYYERRARPWEFQAMLKARAVAGDVALGERLLASIRALCFNPSLSYSPLDGIAAMRTQIKEHIPARERAFNIKLMAGGIRDVEFVAQTIQLLHGARHAELRTPNTLEALGHIARLGLREGWEADTLAEAYRFFRLVEHRLQMMHQIKTHTVPESRDEVALLARRVSAGPLGTYTHASFVEALSRHLNNVRTFAESFFEGEEVHPHSALLMLPEDDERATAIIRQYGIDDVPRVMRTLHTMAYGSFPRLLDRRVREAFEALLPRLLEGVVGMGDPEGAIVRVAQIAATGRSEASFYRLLADARAARDLVFGLASFSSLLTHKLCGQAGALDALLQASGDPAAAADALEEAECFDAAVARKGGTLAGERQARARAWFDRLHLRAFAADYARRFQDMRGPAVRTRAARRHLAAAFESLFPGGRGVALFALGSYAVEEPRLSSDVDLLVVTDGADVMRVTEGVQLAGRWFADVGILKLDFRLRGEGASAPLVQDLSFYESYFAGRMSLWERVAFAKCSAWWGNVEVQEKFIQLVRSAVARPFAPEEIASLVQMRRKVESLAPAKFRAWETKRSPGGRYDVEYLTAMALAARADPTHDFFALTTAERLDRIARHRLIDGKQANTCKSALQLYGVVEHLMELQEITLPRSIEKHQSLSRYLDRTFAFLEVRAPGGADKLLEQTKMRVRACYESMIRKLGE